MEENLDFIEDFKLPNGGTYTGQCKMNGRFVELKGQGEACYPDGSTFKGVFNYGRPLGLGKYLYPNGDFYWGYFNELPNGACYLSEYDGSCFALGHFVDGDLKGWGIQFYNNKFRFGWWEGRQLVQNESKNVMWIRATITQRLKEKGEASLIQVSKDGFVRFGFANHRRPTRLFGADNMFPSVSFKFYNDGRAIVGECLEPAITGNLVIYNPDRSIQYGNWENGTLVKQLGLNDFQSMPEMYYFEQGLFVISA